MWLRRNTRMQHCLLAFSDFLASEAYYEYLTSAARDEQPRCLLDVVEIWLGVGDATDVCPTYDIFLLTVIDIIDAWAVGGRESVVDYPLVPERRPHPGQGPEHAVHQPIPVYYEENEGLSDLLSTPSQHPALRREHFELHQARNLRQRGSALRELPARSD